MIIKRFYGYTINKKGKGFRHGEINRVNSYGSMEKRVRTANFRSDARSVTVYTAKDNPNKSRVPL